MIAVTIVIAIPAVVHALTVIEMMGRSTCPLAIHGA
jgi:ABC-type Fe3+ transport system permease subunit